MPDSARRQSDFERLGASNAWREVRSLLPTTRFVPFYRRSAFTMGEPAMYAPPRVHPRQYVHTVYLCTNIDLPSSRARCFRCRANHFSCAMAPKSDVNCSCVHRSTNTTLHKYPLWLDYSNGI